jgi:DNA-binding transcriptional MerR regulator/DNA gyrase inhibitor GyrI
MKIAINKLAETEGLTSRTLRHWEAEGLIRSERHPESGWRVYGEDDVFCIRLTALLRKFDIPLKEIKKVLDDRTYGKLYTILQNRITDLTDERLLNLRNEKRLKKLMEMLYAQNQLSLTGTVLSELETGIVHAEQNVDITDEMVNGKMKFKVIVLPDMRTAYNTAVGYSPEDDAMEPVFAWIEQAGLKGTARFFGFNVEPWPDGDNPYGFGMCASIPESVIIPECFKEKKIESGLYAVAESDDDIMLSWKAFMKTLSENDIYENDKSRTGFEEHVPIVKSDGVRHGFSIMLMLPVKIKTNTEEMKNG